MPSVAVFPVSTHQTRAGPAVHESPTMCLTNATDVMMPLCQYYKSQQVGLQQSTDTKATVSVSV